MHHMYDACMPTHMQIRNLSDYAHRTYRTRAARAGKSLQEYMHDKLERDAEMTTLEEALAAIENDRGGSTVTAEDIVDAIRADRESH